MINAVCHSLSAYSSGGTNMRALCVAHSHGVMLVEELGALLASAQQVLCSTWLGDPEAFEKPSPAAKVLPRSMTIVTNNSKRSIHSRRSSAELQRSSEHGSVPSVDPLQDLDPAGVAGLSRTNSASNLLHNASSSRRAIKFRVAFRGGNKVVPIGSPLGQSNLSLTPEVSALRLSPEVSRLSLVSGEEEREGGGGGTEAGALGLRP